MRSSDDLLDQLATLNKASFEYALGGVTAANLFAPSLTVMPQPTIWIPAAASANDVARLLGGEVVESGANVRVWQTSGDVALRRAYSLLPTWPTHSGLRVVTPYRAYVEALQATGRGPDAAAALRHTLSLAANSPAPSDA
jgi:hypothetical protein